MGKDSRACRFARQKLEEQGWPVLSQADLPPGVLLDESRLVVRCGRGAKAASVPQDS